MMELTLLWRTYGIPRKSELTDSAAGLVKQRQIPSPYLDLWPFEPVVVSKNCFSVVATVRLDILANNVVTKQPFVWVSSFATLALDAEWMCYVVSFLKEMHVTCHLWIGWVFACRSVQKYWRVLNWLPYVLNSCTQFCALRIQCTHLDRILASLVTHLCNFVANLP